MEYGGREGAGNVETVGGLEPLVQAKRCNTKNFAERRLRFGGHVVLQTAFELLQNRVLAVSARADDEWDAELLAVGVVEAVELREFRFRHAVGGRAPPVPPVLHPHVARPPPPSVAC